MSINFEKYEDAEAKEILRAYRRMFKSIQSTVTKEDQQNIRKAFELAANAHYNQRRKSGEPYILHPIEVARISAAEIGLGPTAVIGALLHDVVEDTPVTVDQIREVFNDRIALIVDGLTKLDKIYDFKIPQAENFKKIMMTLSKDVRVCLIKLADRLHNMRTLGSMPEIKQLRIASETQYVYAPLAHRLGLYNIKTELQDLCMKILDARNYQNIAKKLKETKKGRESYIQEFIQPLSEEFDELDLEYRISGRPKSISSINNKLISKRVPFEEIYDLFAVRVIIDVPPKLEKRKCWEIYSIVTDYYQPIPERLKDWVSNPKSNGYESLHTTVVGPNGKFVEVQIRTERMNDIAEKGFAAHWKYKGQGTSTQQDDIYDRWLGSVREVLEEHADVDSPEFMADFKSNLFTDEVYIFTPDGEMKLLPKGATALDFAFAIHSDIGYHCVAIKVNNNLVPLGYELNNGDQISITTSKSQKPNENWLKMCITGKAKSKIRSAIKEERRKQGELGMEALERKLTNSMKARFDDYNIDFLVKELGLTSRVDLYYAISLEDIVLSKDLKDFECEGGKLKRKPKPVTTVKKPTVLPITEKLLNKKKELPSIYINDEDGSQYNYEIATCCKPVMGDEIFCYVNSKNITKIHRKNCKNAMDLMSNYGYRILKADWGVNKNSSFVASIKIYGIDRSGMAKEITELVTSTLKIDIRTITLEGQGGYFEGTLTIVLNNVDQLNMLIRTLNDVQGVSDVVRIS